MGLALAGPVAAQETAPTGTVRSDILIVEFDRLFAESAFGQKVATAIEEEGADIVAENRRIEAELTAEEKELTEKRATLPPSQFRELADAFDEKVQKLRREQDAKGRALGNLSDDRRRQFLAAVEPILGAIMNEAGAAVILEKRSVFLSAEAIDITDAAIARVNAEIGTGDGLLDDTSPAIQDPGAGSDAAPQP